MIRSELVAKLRKEHELAPREARAVVDAFFDAITVGLEERNRIEMRGFGVFTPRRHEPRKKRNPRTGETVEKGVTYLAHFKTGRALHRRLNTDAGSE